MNEHVRKIREAFAFRPLPTQTLDRWADANRFLSPSSGAISGAWKTSRVEVARGPMRAISEPGVKTITCMVATQMLKTELLLNTVAYHVVESPCPILLVQPKDDMAKAFSKERFAPMVRETPALRHILTDAQYDRSGEAMTFRTFPGGFLAMVGAGSPSNLAMRAIRVTLLDEIDKYEVSKEGDPVRLAEERASTFPDALHIRTCSPTIEGESRIEKSFLDGDQRKPFIECPHCQSWHVLSFFKRTGFAYVDWQKTESGEHLPMTAALYCGACGAEISEADRLKSLTTEGGVRWHQTKSFECCGERQEPMKTRRWNWNEQHAIGRAACVHCGKDAVPNHHASFWASKLYFAKITITQLAEAWLSAKDDMDAKQTFINTQLAETFSAQIGRRVETHELSHRREEFGSEMVAEIIRLTAGVDVQQNRLEVHIIGWAWPLEAWSIHYEVIEGSPASPETWQRLDKFLQQRFPHALGVTMPISAVCIDTGGHFTEHVYRFCQSSQGARNIWAIKGASWSKRGDPVWPVPKSRKTRTKDFSFKPFIIASDSAKDFIREMFLTEEPGPGYFHLPMQRDDGWLAQLTAEQPVWERKNGVQVRKWILPQGRANEALDTTVYSYAALCGLMARKGLKMERAAAEFPSQVLRFKGEMK